MAELSGEELLRMAYILMHPTRFKIIQALKEAGRPLYIREIADKIGENHRIVSFHLTILAEHGFVEGEYRVIEEPKERSKARGKAGKFYRLTPKVDEILKKIVEIARL